MQNELLKSWLASIIRIGGTGAWVYLVSKGYVSDAQVTQLISILAGMIVMLGWSLWAWIHTQKTVEKALELPAGTSRSVLKDVLNSQKLSA